MASKQVCINCGTIYSAKLKRCPLCGETETEVREFDAEGNEVVEAAKAANLVEEISPEQEKAEAAILNAVEQEIEAAAPKRIEKQLTEMQPQEEPKEKRKKKEKKQKSQMPKAAQIACVFFMLAAVGMLTWYILAQWLPDKVPFPAAKVETNESTQTPSQNEKKDCWYLSCDVEKLTLDHEGAAKTLQIDVQPEECVSTVTFASEDEKIAKVDANGIVTAVGEGKTKVIVSCGELSVEVLVNCNFSAKIELSASELIFEEIGQSERLILRNLGESDVVTWGSTDVEVAKVDSYGEVTAVGEGECIIMAALDGQTFTATVKVGDVPENNDDDDDEPTEGMGVINSDGIYFRSGPSSDYDDIGFFMEGFEVEILGKDGDWYHVNYDGTDGYVHEKYVDVQ